MSKQARDYKEKPKSAKTAKHRTMRLDYVLYVVAVICFLFAGMPASHCLQNCTDCCYFMAMVVVLGLAFAVVGTGEDRRRHRSSRKLKTIH